MYEYEIRNDWNEAFRFHSVIDSYSIIFRNKIFQALFTFEFYETGILAYRSENNQEFYVCEPASLASFYQTVEQICSQYSSTPASLALMDYGALNSMTISSTTGTSRKEVGLIRDHAQTLFSFLQQLHVSKGSVREESVMFSRPEYHADIEFASGMVIRLDINSGSLLIDGGDGELVPVVAHFRARQAEDLHRYAKLKGTQTVIRQHDHLRAGNLS